MKNARQRFVYLFPLLIGLIYLPATFADPLVGAERVVMAAQQTVISPGSLIFKSEDRGESWTTVGSVPDVHTLTPDPAVVGTLYAGSSVGLYKSVNGGATWTLSANGLPIEPVKAIVVDPTNTKVVYAGTSNPSRTGTVYKSIDGGATWAPSDTGLNARLVNGLAMSPSNSNTIYAGTISGMFKSVDGGANWVAINNGLTYIANGSPLTLGISVVSIDPSNPDVIYATSFPAFPVFPWMVQKSTNGGNSWRPTIVSGVFYTLVIDPLNTSTLYGGFNNPFDSGIAKLTDGGSVSQRVLPEQPIDMGVRDSSVAKLAIDPVTPSTIYAGVNNLLEVNLVDGTVIKKPSRLKPGLYKSVDSGGIWSLKTNGLPDKGIAALAIDPQNPSRLYAASATMSASVSAASYSGVDLARESIAAMFGPGLATATEGATSIPLLITLADVSIKVRDNRGNERDAPLFYASPTQVNYQIPPGVFAGGATVAVSRGGEVIAVETLTIANVNPGLFSADASGGGPVAGVALRVMPDGSQSYEKIVNFDQAQNKFVTIPIDLGPESDRVFLSVFGTGFRFRSSESAVKVTIGGVEVPVTYANLQPTLTALDQINVLLTRTLAGKGEVDLVVKVDGKMANTTRVAIK
jgi:uncharacterized protein (TIGR03437 family)